MAKTKKKNYTLVLLFVLLIGISVGYAAFAQTLTITGTATANGSFSLDFTNAEVISEVGASNVKATISEDAENLSIDMDLEYPGAGAVIKATITNNGSIAAKLKNISFTGNNDPDIKVSFEQDATEDPIEPNGTKEISITVKWDEGSTTAKKLNFMATLEYEQAAENFDDNSQA